jgi:hypothetical protein
MRKLLCCSLMAIGVMAAAPALARDTAHNLRISDVLQLPEFKDKVGSDVAFFFGAQRSPPVTQTFGEFVSNRKTNAFGKSDEVACRWAMLSALVAFKERALKEGGDAVINIVSFYKKDASSSETDYECHAGGLMAGVALKGTVVRLRTHRQ